MGSLNLDLKSQQIFGKYLPSVYIGRTNIENVGPEDVPTLGELDGTQLATRYNSQFKIYFSTDGKTGDTEDIKDWIRNNLNNLYFYTTLSPFPNVHTALKESKLDLKGFINLHFAEVYNENAEKAADYHTLWDDPTQIDVFHPGFDTIVSGIKYLYLSSRPDEEALLDPSSDVYTDFYGSNGESGPFTDGWIYEHWAEIVEYLRGPHKDLKIARKIPLSDLVDHIYEKNVYDSDGNPIMEFANIELDFYTQWNDDDGYSVMTGGSTTNTGDLYLVAFIGLDIHELQDEHPALYNANFGDITYEHLLSDGSVPNESEEIFVEADNGTPYNGVPIQTINGKYYIPQPVKQETITDAMTSLLDSFQRHKDSDPDLAQNMNNLGYIIQTKGTHVDLIPQLQLFRKTYPDKSSVSNSGKMYASFKTLLYNYNKGVHLQTLLKKQLVVNSKVVDLRFAQLNAWYLMPNPSFSASPADGADTGEWDLRGYVIRGSANAEITDFTGADISFPDGIASDMYIPTKWTRMTRQTRNTVPVNDSVRSDFYEFAIEEGYLDAYNTSQEQRDALEELLGDDGAVPLGDEEEAQAFEVLDTGGASDMAYILMRAKEQFYEDQLAGVLFDSSGTQFTDKVVENKGMWFFDWEKAVRTQSNLGHLFNLSKLERYFRFTIPYKYFKVLNAKMYRKEHMFAPLQTDDGTTASPFWEEDVEGTTRTICIESVMRDKRINGSGQTNDSLPWTYRTHYYHDPDNLKWGQPYVNISDQLMTNTTTPSDAQGFEQSFEAAILNTDDNIEQAYHPSYLVFKNFDVTAQVDAGTSSRRMGNLMNYGTISGEMNFTEGLRVHSSYRLMTFEYRDFMDDDVAYYNTPPGISDSGNIPTNYFIVVEVEDRSLELINYFYNMLLEEWNNFIENYYEYAIAWCSYNNITDEFNDFFKDAIYEKYPEPADWPWVRAVYLYNLYRALVFRSFDPASTGALPGEAGSLESEILLDTKKLIDKIGPDNGLLSSLEEFKDMFSKLVYRFKADPEVAEYINTGLPLTRIYDRILELAQIDVDGLPADAAPDDLFQQANDTTNRLIFSNYLPIEEPIYGDLSLTAFNDGDFTPDLDWTNPDFLYSSDDRRVHPSPTDISGVGPSRVIYASVGIPDPGADKELETFFHGTSTGFTVSLRITSEVGWIADSDLNVYHEAAVSPDGSPCKIDLNDWADEHYGGYTNNMGQHILDQAYMDIRIEHRDPAGTWNHNFKVAYLGIIEGDDSWSVLNPAGIVGAGDTTYSDGDDVSEHVTYNDKFGGWFNVEPIAAKRGRTGYTPGSSIPGTEGDYELVQRYYPDIRSLGGYTGPWEAGGDDVARSDYEAVG